MNVSGRWVEYLHFEFSHFTPHVGGLNVRHSRAKVLTKYGKNWGTKGSDIVP